MKLPLDYTLCDGNGEPACSSCLRRIADRPQIYWATEALAEGDVCALRLDAYPEKKERSP